MLCRQSDGPLHPVQIVVSFGWLQCRPRELADAYNIHVGVLHQLEVGFPCGLRPLLGIPRGTEAQTLRCGSRLLRAGKASGEHCEQK